MFFHARSKLSPLLATGILLALTLGWVNSPARADHPVYPHPDQWLIQAARQAQMSGVVAASHGAAQSRNLTLVSSVALPGFNADVWGHKGFAYVGTWGFLYPDFCPATGIRIIDLKHKKDPVLVGAVATIPGTTQEDVEVVRIETKFFHGDLLVAGIQSCDGFPDAPMGIDLWDVTDPYNPHHLAFWPSGGPGGVHELNLFRRGNRAYVAAAVPFSDFVSDQGDFRLVDVTDPTHPMQVSEWGAISDGGLIPGAGQDLFAHSATANKDGDMAILSYWDAGAIFLDISDPTAPTFVGRTVYPADADGDTHSIALARGDHLLLTADEDFSPAFGPPPPAADANWGFLRIWDVKDPAVPAEIGRFGTPNSLSGATDGFFSIHNPLAQGGKAYLSWYSDGVRVVDISKPSAPHEVASFVPPAAPDPFGFFPPVPLVWGVHIDRGLILLSDINAGLYVLKP